MERMATNGKSSTIPKAASTTNVTNSSLDEEVEYRMADPPDGGWGWVVVFSSFMIHVIADGVTYTFGIFYMEFLKDFKESKGTTSWVASIMVGTTFCVGPIASGLTNKFGCRSVTIFGSLLATFGLIMSTMAPSVIHLFFTIGLCTGAGFGLMYLPTIVCVTCYFEKRRAFATGIAVCGSGIGTFVLAPITEWMVDELGWKGAMLIVSGLVLHCCVFGALFRPLERVPVSPARSKSYESVEKIPNGFRKASLPNGTICHNEVNNFRDLNECVQSYSQSALPIDNHPSNGYVDKARMARSMTLHTESPGLAKSKSRSSITSLGLLSRKDIFYSGSIQQIANNNSISNLHIPKTPALKQETKDSQSFGDVLCACLCPSEMREAFVQMMDFRLMTNVIFLMFGFSNFFTNIGFNVPFVYTKDRAVGMNIADENRASYLLSVIGIANTVGRVILGYLSDRPWVNRLWLYNSSLALCGISTALSSFCDSYSLMSLYAIVFGATAGAYVSLTSVILVDLLGLDKLTNAFGLLLVFEGVACLIGPPITGWLHDFTGSYDPGFYVSGIMIAISGLMLFFIPCVQRIMEKKREKSKERMQICLDTCQKESSVNHNFTPASAV